jgi:hypothetical protein
MPDVFPKFIVEGNNLVIGKCTYHKQMATELANVKCGGYWEWERDRKIFHFYGTSDDFGYPEPEHLKPCIEVGNVFLSHSRGRKVTDHTFYLNVGNEIIKLN